MLFVFAALLATVNIFIRNIPDVGGAEAILLEDERKDLSRFPKQWMMKRAFSYIKRSVS